MQDSYLTNKALINHQRTILNSTLKTEAPLFNPKTAATIPLLLSLLSSWIYTLIWAVVGFLHTPSLPLEYRIKNNNICSAFTIGIIIYFAS